MSGNDVTTQIVDRGVLLVFNTNFESVVYRLQKSFSNGQLRRLIDYGI
jgi:hypothetical protein